MSDTMKEGPSGSNDEEEVAATKAPEAQTEDESPMDLGIGAEVARCTSEDPKATALKLLREGDPEKFNTWKDTQKERIDLSGVNFSGLDLTQYDLSGADLTGAILVNVTGLRHDILSTCILLDITVDRRSEGILNAATTLVRKSWKRSGSEEDY